MVRHMNRFRIATTLTGLLLVASLAGCGKEEATPQVGVEVTVVKVTPQDTPVTTEFVGKTQSSRRVEIRSRVEGFLEKRLYTEGTMVQEGQALFQMDQKPFQAELDAAQAELAQQKARLRTATANLKRVKPLAAENALPQKELDDAEGSYRSARAAVEAAQAKVVQAELNMGYTTIVSPVTGLSSFANQREGAYIGIGSSSLLTYVAQLDPMWVEFSISENQILKQRQQAREGLVILPEGQNYEVEVVLADGSTYPHTGHITFADASLSEETGTFLIRAELPNPDMQLRPGQFVRARIKGAKRPNAILLPQRAVQQGAKGSFVWVVDDKGQAEFRPVTVGRWYGDEWFIDTGLQEGETVVVDGALRLRAGVPVKIVEPKTEGDETSKPQKDAG
jgi:membrane fusion protein (multidrug efflux system)